MSVSTNQTTALQEVLLGFDPGRDKCGLAVMDCHQTLYHHEVVAAEEAIATIQSIQHTFHVQRIILGDQTTSATWKRRLEYELTPSIPVSLVDERYTTLAARDRYWKLYPPRNFLQLIPQGLRQIPRPIDDIVAILLIERYLSGNSSATD